MVIWSRAGLGYTFSGTKPEARLSLIPPDLSELVRSEDFTNNLL